MNSNPRDAEQQARQADSELKQALDKERRHQQSLREDLQKRVAKQVKPWLRMLRSDDYDFRSWTAGATRNRLRAGAIYEYARESRKLRSLLVLMNPRRPRHSWEEPDVLPFSFENLHEDVAAGALDGFLYCLCDLADHLAQNISFGELFRVQRDELENAFGGLDDLSRVKRPFRYFLPVVDAVELAETSEVQHATTKETILDDEKRIICGEACSEVIAMQFHWRCGKSEMFLALKDFVETHRPRKDGYKPRQRKRGSRRDSAGNALNCLSAMRLASYAPKQHAANREALRSYVSGDHQIDAKKCAIDLFRLVRLGGGSAEIAESNFDGLVAQARKLFSENFPFGEQAANARMLAQRVMMKSERISP